MSDWSSLVALVDLAGPPPPRRTLHCHPTVTAALTWQSHPWAPKPEPSFMELGRIGDLCGIDVYEEPEMMPGAWEIREGAVGGKGGRVVNFGGAAERDMSENCEPVIVNFSGELTQSSWPSLRSAGPPSLPALNTPSDGSAKAYARCFPAAPASACGSPGRSTASPSGSPATTIPVPLRQYGGSPGHGGRDDDRLPHPA